MWVAEGFIQPSQGDNRLLEEIGNEYFQILLWNSFFQDVKTNRFGEIKSCRIHDLVHDLAQSVAGTHERSIMEASEMGDVSKFRRLNLLNVNDESSTTVVSKLLNISKSKLRTLFIEGGRVKDIVNDFFNSNKQLRVLDLSHTNIEELPPSIGDLKHLRYLDLSQTDIKQLPDSFTRLYNLQTLKLVNCRCFHCPKDLNKLINLRHLLYNRFGVPEDIGGCCVGGIGQLQCLNLLRGKLNITGLKRVNGRENAESANLIAKKYIQQLSLTWNYPFGEGSIERREDEYSNDILVLEGLQPHPNLRTLKIYNFMGPKFPTWMINPLCLQNLVILELYRCNRCKQLPSLGVLPSLRFLEIYKMMHLEEWLDQPIMSSSSSSSLESIKISKCPKLKSMPTKFFSLKEFTVWDASNAMGVSSIVRSNLDTLTQLVIWHIDGLKFLPQGLLKGNNLLQSLDIRGCPDFQGFIQEVEGDEDLLLSSSSSSLHTLWLHHCPILTLLPGDLRALTSLQRLTIRCCGESNDDHCKSIEMSDCPMLKSMTTMFPFMKELTFNSCDGKIVTSVLRSNLMDTLTELSLSNIPGLMFLPLGLLKDNNVLQSLVIRDCPDFQGFIQEVEGDEDLSLSSSSNRSSSSLWELDLRNCPVLTFPGDLRALTSLRELFIDGCGQLNVDHCESIEMSDCPMLKSMPTMFPFMKELTLSSCDGKIVTSVLRSNLIDILTELSLSNIPGLMFLPLGLLKDNNVLQSLDVRDCPDFQGYIQEVEGDEDQLISSSSSLYELWLCNCPVLRLLPDLKDWTSLRFVTVEGCSQELVIVLPDGVKNWLKS